MGWYFDGIFFIVGAVTSSRQRTSRLERVHAPGERVDGVQDGVESDSFSVRLVRLPVALWVPDCLIRRFFGGASRHYTPVSPWFYQAREGRPGPSP